MENLAALLEKRLQDNYDNEDLDDCCDGWGEMEEEGEDEDGDEAEDDDDSGDEGDIYEGYVPPRPTPRAMGGGELSDDDDDDDECEVTEQSQYRSRVIESDSDSDSDASAVGEHGDLPATEEDLMSYPMTNRPVNRASYTPLSLMETEPLPPAETAAAKRVRRMAEAAFNSRPAEVPDATRRLARFFPEAAEEEEDGAGGDGGLHEGESPQSTRNRHMARKLRLAHMARQSRSSHQGEDRDGDMGEEGLPGSLQSALEQPMALATEVLLTRDIIKLYVRDNAFMNAVGELASASDQAIVTVLEDTASQVAVIDVTLSRASAIADGLDAAMTGTDLDHAIDGYVMAMGRYARVDFPAALVGYLAVFITFYAADQTTEWYVGERKHARSAQRKVPVPTEDEAVCAAMRLCKLAMKTCPVVEATSREGLLAERLATLELG